MPQITVWFICLMLILLGLFLWKQSFQSMASRRKVMILYLSLQSVYLIWRVAGGTIPFNSFGNGIFGSLLFLTEVLSFTQTIIFILLFWSEGSSHQPRIMADEFLPKVDIFIATYNESIDILKQTLVSALMVDYPSDLRNVYICDDGNRQFVKDLAREWKVNYLARNDRQGAKAGNLNYALLYSSSDFVVTMDADMRMKPQFLKKVIPYFKDDKMGFVQSPQAFHNSDVFQHNLYAENQVRNDQDFFMRFLQVSKNRFGAVIYVGSNAIFRRSALSSVGGFVTDVITEDMATGLLVQNQGWKSEFVNEVLATGLAPETFPELVKQRVRWARGNVQVFKKYGPRSLKNLSSLQKLLYIDGVHYWFFGIYHLLYLSFPILSILFGVEVISSNARFFMPIWLLTYALSNFVFSSVAGKDFRPMWSSVAELAIFPYVLIGVLKEVVGVTTNLFSVTSKGQVIEKHTFHLKMMWTQIVLLSLSILALLVMVNRLVQNPVETLIYQSIPLFWLIYNIFSLIGALHIAVDRPRYQNELLDCSMETTLRLGDHQEKFELVQIHDTKAVVQGLTSGYVTGQELELVVNGDLVLPVVVKQIILVDGLVNISLEILVLDHETYMALHYCLDYLNTVTFSDRHTNYRSPAFNFTLGYYLKRLKFTKNIEY